MKSKPPLQKQYSKIVAYKTAFGTPAGRQVLLDLCEAHNVFSSIFDINANVMYSKDGERIVILRILKMLKISPAQMADLAEEIEKNARSSNDANSADTGPADTTTRIAW